VTHNPLEKIIGAEIRAGGPMSMARYMALVLGHPEHGYYMGRDPFGADGDFTTAPEISQMFGELVGLWCADTWTKMDPGGPMLLAELGPGRGTLMADALRAARAVLPAFFDAVDVHLVETSGSMRRRQKSTLGSCGKTITWHESFDELPHGPLLLIANELFDALPVHQVEARGGKWYERCVTADADGALSITLGDDTAPAEITPPMDTDPRDGAIFEASPQRNRLAAAIALRLATHGGAALIVDYGHTSPGFGDTLQAVRSHQFCKLFADPGKADVTAHVDFSAIAGAATTAGATSFEPIGMGDFLDQLGLAARAERLKSGADAKTAETIDAAVRRLTEPDQMGSHFKVLVIAAPNGPVPAPF